MPVLSFHGPRALPLLAAALVALALPTPSRAETAPQTIGGEPVVQIATGSEHSCALVQSGQVWCWGRNFFGALGDDTRGDSSTPVQVQGLTGVTQIAAGGYHNCALRSTGRVFCWGSNGNGQIGDGTVSDQFRLNDRLTPVRVTGLTGVTAIAAGNMHSCAVRDTGRVFCWGSNGSGELGDGTTTDRLTPVRVEGRWSADAVQIAAGSLHTCLLNQGGTLACWGHNWYGQLGDGTNIDRLTPVPVRGLRRITQVATGSVHSCALRDTGRVFCWGENGTGQLGDGTFNNRSQPVRVRDLSAVTQIGTGSLHSCAVRTSGRVFCWGHNSTGELGTGTTFDRTGLPVRVVGLVNATQVDLGQQFSCGVQADGQAFCWGYNERGQLGDGTTTNRSRATPVVD